MKLLGKTNVSDVPTKLLHFTFLAVIMAEHNRRVSGVQQKSKEKKKKQRQILGTID